MLANTLKNTSKHPLRVAIVGASGLVGRHFLAILAEIDFPISRLRLLASERSAGNSVQFAGKDIVIEDLATFTDYHEVDLALFSAGGSVSLAFAPRFEEAGAVVIDNSSAYRYHDDVPLVIPEVNPQALDTLTPGKGAIIANPNCSTIQMLVALKPIEAAFGITHIDVATYQAVGGSGQGGIDALKQELAAHALGNAPEAHPPYDKPIALNVIPKIDTFLDSGFTKEEMKMHWESRKILDSDVVVNATCVRVPVFVGHAEAIHLTLKEPAESIEAVEELLKKAPGVKLLEQNDYPTPLIEGAGTDQTYVGRLRYGVTNDKTHLNLWVVADNLRKGAALNAIQIAAHMLELGFWDV